MCLAEAQYQMDTLREKRCQTQLERLFIVHGCTYRHEKMLLKHDWSEANLQHKDFSGLFHEKPENIDLKS